MSRAMVLQDDQGVVYPRVIPVPEGLEWLGERWEVRETLYQTGKGEGLPYTRYFTKAGHVPSHSGVLSASAAIRLDSIDRGYDFEEAYQAFKEAAAARHARESAERAKEREAAGIVKGEQREAAIRAFRGKHFPLTGAIVQAFPGWRVRWDYLPSCDQTHVTYTDASEKDWKLLKDIESCLGCRILNGEDLSELIEAGTSGADPDLFAQGAKHAKATHDASASPKRGVGRTAVSAQDAEGTGDRAVSSVGDPGWIDLVDLGVADIVLFFRGLKLDQFVDAVQELSIDGVTLQQMCRTDSLADMGITNRIHQHKVCGHLHKNGLQKVWELCGKSSGPESRPAVGPPAKRARTARDAGPLARVPGSVEGAPAAESAETRQLCRVRGKTKPRAAREPSPRERRVATSGFGAHSAIRRATTHPVEDLTEGEVALPADPGVAKPLPDAAPASYTVVLHTGLPVQEGVHLETPHLGQLPCGAVVDVKEAVAFQDRVRGRIEHLLAGWISLSCISTGLVCAERVAPQDRPVDRPVGAQQADELRASYAAGVARGVCAAGHMLERHEADQPGWRCNFCQAEQPVGASMWGCRTCDFDKCASCHVGGPSHDSGDCSDAQGPREVPVVELDDD